MEWHMTRETKLLYALQDCVKDGSGSKDDVGCDHSVGICYCSYFAALDNAKAVLAEHIDKLPIRKRKLPAT
jgi:hypothetical protein